MARPTHTAFKALIPPLMLVRLLMLGALVGIEWTIAKLSGHSQLPMGTIAGFGVGVTALLVGRLVILLPALSQKPFRKLLATTAVRLLVPIVALAAIAVSRREVLTDTFLAYFLPFVLFTLVADTLEAVRRVNTQ